MTTLAVGRAIMMASHQIEKGMDAETIEYRLKAQAQADAMSLGEHPYYCQLLMVEMGLMKPEESMEERPNGWEECIWLWDELGASEQWNAEYEETRAKQRELQHAA